MSSHGIQQTLADIDPDDASNGDDADAVGWSPTSVPPATCQSCGARVSRRFARVFGDRDDTLHCCPDCAPLADIKAGLAANPDRDRMEATQL